MPYNSPLIAPEFPVACPLPVTAAPGVWLF